MDDMLYREEILERYHAAPHRGRLAAPDLHAELDNPLCGDRIGLGLELGPGGRIVRVLFDGQGCVISQVAASFLAEHLEGMPVHEARRLSADEAVNLLGIRLSPMRVKCGCWPGGSSTVPSPRRANRRQSEQAPVPLHPE